jgi:prevent-host-death family protein
MSELAFRELRNDTAAVLRRVREGEDVTITVNGRPVAVIARFTLSAGPG